MAPPNTPFIYRLWHLYLEPFFALGGVYHLHWAPAQYFTFMPATSAYHPDSQIAYDQLASAYLFFAFTRATGRTGRRMSINRPKDMALMLN